MDVLQYPFVQNQLASFSLKRAFGCRSNLFAFSVALEDEGAERGLFFVSVAPVSALNQQSHQPPVFLVGCKLAHLSKLELRREQRTQLFLGAELHWAWPNLLTLGLKRVKCTRVKTGSIFCQTYTYSRNLSLRVNQPVVKTKESRNDDTAVVLWYVYTLEGDWKWLQRLWHNTGNSSGNDHWLVKTKYTRCHCSNAWSVLCWLWLQMVLTAQDSRAQIRDILASFIVQLEDLERRHPPLLVNYLLAVIRCSTRHTKQAERVQYSVNTGPWPSNPRLLKLAKVTSLVGEEPELVWEVDGVGLT